MHSRRFTLSQVTATVRERIQAQGFCGLDDATYAQVNYPLRLSPTICMVWVAVGTAFASPTILWALVPFAALGAILPGHPFDVLYNYGLRHLLGTPALPRYGVRRHLACAEATLMVIAAAWGFQAGMPMVRLYCRRVRCSRCVRASEYGVLYTLVLCSHILWRGGLWVI
jgi:hypothetical protein